MPLRTRRTAALRSFSLDGGHGCSSECLGRPKQARRLTQACRRGKPGSRVGGESSSTCRLQGMRAVKRHGHQTEGEREALLPKS